MKKPFLITHLLENQLSDRVAIVDKIGHHTFSDINSLAGKIAEWLVNSRIKAGDRIIICGINSSRLVAAMFGVLKINGVIVPIHPDTPTTRFGFVLQDCMPAAIVIDANRIQTHADILRHIKIPVLITSDEDVDNNEFELNIATWDSLIQYTERSKFNQFDSNSLAAIIYTSGSSKDPRGVMLPHRQVIFATTAINSVIGNDSRDIILCGLPLSFDYGLYQIFLTFQAGAKLVLEPDFHIPMVIPRLINKYSVTGFPGVPSIFAMLLRSRLLERSNLPSLRYITSTGDVFPASHIEKLQKLLPKATIFPMYGLTECKRVSIMPRNQLKGHESSVGLPLPDTSVLIIDEMGQMVHRGEVGELVVRGPHVMAGYWNNPEETARRFRFDISKSETVLHTGDIFYTDDDGFLYFVGRREMFIKSRGHKISPLEIEAAIYKLKGVIEVAVVGVPDPILGESIWAFVSLMNSENVGTSEITEYCRSNLSLVACPSYVVALKSLPKTANGKIDRIRLCELALEMAETRVETTSSIDTLNSS
jgi:amino acid adenylation domain-containing protein